MDTEAANRYRRAKAIAFELLERSPEERPAALREACGGDDALRREAEWLLEAAENEADDLPAPAESVRRSAAIEIEAPLPRNYRVLGALGEGGMGAVYLAERVDGDLGQRVALKLLNAAALPDGALARRFAIERRILASLHHPNIAHLVDAGISSAGRPFLAMEYVEGEHIDTWCRDRALPLRARVELFLKVCAAVEYAHRHLVIHRDIKPANILVGADGEPKLLDFGIARLLDDGADDLRTETGMRALTLAYASPEQVAGKPLSTATDVYSLGVVLYQLLTGSRPFDHLATAHEVSNAIVSGEIPPPSRLLRRQAGATSVQANAGEAPAQAAPAPPPRWRVPADLDAIILKALRREPAQRYASVAELADDLGRWLASRPVRARRGHWPYRARRFAWRWRWPLAACAVLAALLAGFTFDRLAQLERVARERDRAQAIVAFMNDLFENADSLRSRGNTVTVREMLDRGARELGKRSDLSDTQRGSMLLAMGRAYNALGLGEAALPLLKQAQSLLAPASAVERAEVLAEIGATLSTGRSTAASIAADEEAIALLRSDAGDHADEIARLRIRALHNHVNLLDIPLARSRSELGSIRTELLARPHVPERLLMQVDRALATAFDAGGDLDQANAMAEEALALAERVYGPDDPRVLANRFAVAMIVGKRDPQRAVPIYRALAADYERLVGPGLNLVGVLNNLAVTLSQSGALDEAFATYRRAADVARQSVGESHWLYLTTLSNLATLQVRNGHVAEAKALIERVLPGIAAAAETASGMDPGYYAAALGTLAETQLAEKHPGEAAKTWARAAAVLDAVDPNAYAELRAEIRAGLAKTQAPDRAEAGG